MRRLLLFVLMCWPFLFSGTICNVVVGRAVTVSPATSFPDTFDGIANGEAPSTSLWGSVVQAGTIDANSYFNIQDGDLESHFADTMSTQVEAYFTANTLSTQANRYISATTSDASGIGGYAHYNTSIYIGLSASNNFYSGTSAPSTSVAAMMYHDSTGFHIKMLYIGATGTESDVGAVAKVTCGAGSHTIKLVLDSTTEAHVEWDGSTVLSSRTIGWTAPANHYGFVRSYNVGFSGSGGTTLTYTSVDIQ